MSKAISSTNFNFSVTVKNQSETEIAILCTIVTSTIERPTYLATLTSVHRKIKFIADIYISFNQNLDEKFYLNTKYK